jgi:phage gpG-like protein
MAKAMSADTKGLWKIVHRFSSVKPKLDALANDKQIVAIIGQAISDNFSKQGPGWAPLKVKTIRSSVSKKNKKKLSQMSDEEILKHEMKERKKGEEGEQYRQILVRTGTLRNSVTKPSSQHNIYRVEGKNIIWGTNLSYAKIHNEGYPKKGIPKREFLVIRPTWKSQIEQYVSQKIKSILRSLTEGE